MRNYLMTTVLVLGLMVSVVLGAYVYWSYVDATGTSSVASGVAAAQERQVDGQAAGTGALGENGSEPIDSVFIHRATAESISSNSTYLDNRLINDNPDAILSVTQNWNPEGGDGVYNAHPVGVWYDDPAGRWAIFNEDRASMPEGAAFNVVVAAAATDAR